MPCTLTVNVSITGLMKKQLRPHWARGSFVKTGDPLTWLRMRALVVSNTMGEVREHKWNTWNLPKRCLKEGMLSNWEWSQSRCPRFDARFAAVHNFFNNVGVARGPAAAKTPLCTR